jgi:TPP-dependent pyruvate/acetoin dehydrogenase alpha subunit
MFDAQLYRTKEEVELWKERDPLVRMEAWLAETHLISTDELAAIEAEVESEIADAVAFAEAGTLEPVEDLERFALMKEVPA